FERADHLALHMLGRAFEVRQAVLAASSIARRQQAELDRVDITLENRLAAVLAGRPGVAGHAGMQAPIPHPTGRNHARSFVIYRVVNRPAPSGFGEQVYPAAEIQLLIGRTLRAALTLAP